MNKARTYYLSSRIVERAQPLLDSGRFDTLSEVCRYAVRSFQEWLDSQNGTPEVPHLRRTGDYKRSLPLSEWVMQRIMDHDILGESEIVDYALDFYLRRNGL